MKRSDINQLIRDASACFADHGWALPPKPRWDVTDLGLGNWRKFGLVLVNLAEEPEYCEKLMYAKRGMVTPRHYHRKKKEDIVCRWGMLAIQTWPPGTTDFASKMEDGAGHLIQVNGVSGTTYPGEIIELGAGERVTLAPTVWHSFVPLSLECIIGEVSTANDDFHDNFFADPKIGRFPDTVEDEPPIVKLLSDG